MKSLNLIHLNGLRAAEAVARLGGLAPAAEELGVSPGAVSQQLARVESELGVTLFDRTGKGLVPRPGSAAFIARLHEGFSTLSQAVGDIRHRDDMVLTISVAPILASRWLVHRLPAFATRHPDIRLRIEADDRFVPLGRAMSILPCGSAVAAGRMRMPSGCSTRWSFPSVRRPLPRL